MDVCGEDVDDGTEDGAYLLKDVHWFCGRDGTRVASCAEGGFGAGDEGCEAGRVGIVVEDRFVADDDHFYGGVVAGSPSGDVGDLFGGSGDAAGGDVDSEDEFEVVGCCCGADSKETITVGAIKADGGEAFGGHVGDINLDISGLFAGACFGVWGVCHAPLRTGCSGY